MVDEIVACNPRANRAYMLDGAEFDADGNLQKWYTCRVTLVTSTPVHTFAVDV